MPKDDQNKNSRKGKRLTEDVFAETPQEQILKTEYSELMQKSYIDYAMSVIVARAAIASLAAEFACKRRLKDSSSEVVMNFIERAPPRTLMHSPCDSKYSISRRNVMLDSSGKRADNSFNDTNGCSESIFWIISRRVFPICQS